MCDARARFVRYKGASGGQGAECARPRHDGVCARLLRWIHVVPERVFSAGCECHWPTRCARTGAQSSALCCVAMYSLYQACAAQIQCDAPPPYVLNSRSVSFPSPLLAWSTGPTGYAG